ncbi:flippase-like domain-containing protein [Candidatus Woesearchaeota archaeon]|nr:flippase-like domain-containing protein [Candidatus Woesearchaeota archaeon]
MIKKQKKAVKIVFAVILAFVLVYFLLTQITVHDLSELFSRLSLYWILFAFICYVFSYVFRAWRFKFLLTHELRMFLLFNIVCVHNMINQLLPFRTGELSFIYLIKKQKISGTKAMFSLFVARAFDFAAIAVIFIISVFFIDLKQPMHTILFATCIILFVLVLLIISLVFFNKTYLKILKKLLALKQIKKSKIIKFILTKMQETIRHFNTMKSIKHIFIIALFSILTWISIYLMCCALFAGMGITLTFWTIVAGVSLTFFAVMLPIHGIAGFGTIEAAWSIFFFLLGLSKEIAISSSFVYHLIVILFFMILGISGLACLKLFAIRKK